MTDNLNTIKSLALFAALATAFDGLHPLCDQWVQNDKDACGKGLHGDHLVRRDGTPVSESSGHQAQTMTASAYGRRAAARHVASYSAVQLAAAVAITRSLGHRVPAGALLAGTAINAITHGVIDRRDPLIWLAKKAGKYGYVQHATVVRKAGGESTEHPEPVQDVAGPGTALMELDQALHRAIGVAAAAVTAYIAARARR
ncbi:hypothetical protein ACFV0R_25575 [Streptomyces sp. NPDC059578]|uniref:hypothetical protein n=1 Tax=Streptomyces sp. NPDC059578 TaxID=3346874 RepID=UPI0036B604F3